MVHKAWIMLLLAQKHSILSTILCPCCVSSLQLYQRLDFSTGAFLRILRNILTCNIIKNEAPPLVLSREF